MGSDGKAHIYALNLATTSGTPTATQVSSFSAASLDAICSYQQAQTTLVDPTTLFVVLQVAGPNGCNMGGDSYQLVHYTDAATTAPLTVSVPNNNFTPLYQVGGALGGLVLLDSSKTSTYFYPDDTFTNPSTLSVSGISLIPVLPSQATPLGQLGTGFGLFVLAQAPSGGVQSQELVRINASGTASVQYTTNGAIGIPVADTNNSYFTDSAANQIVQVPLAGGSAIQLFNIASAGVTTLIGSNGALVCFTTIPQGGGTATVNAVSVGTTTVSARLLASFTGASSIGGFMASPAGHLSASVVFATATIGTIGSNTYASAAVSPDSTVQQAPTANSAFLNPMDLGRSVLQVRGITGVGDFGGGSLLRYDVGTNTTTTFALVGGGAYTTPAGSMIVFPESNVIGSPEFLSSSSAGTTSAAALDVSVPFIAPVTLANTSVSPL